VARLPPPAPRPASHRAAQALGVSARPEGTRSGPGPSPYTRALLSAVPGSAGARIRLSGEPRSPIDPSPTACRFHGRCPVGFDRCRDEMPVLRVLGGEHAVVCHLVGGGLRPLSELSSRTPERAGRAAGCCCRRRRRAAGHSAGLAGGRARTTGSGEGTMSASGGGSGTSPRISMRRARPSGWRSRPSIGPG
jgi:oligopeptide/dipeptide ABC transporter ATP-binding protein